MTKSVDLSIEKLENGYLVGAHSFLDGINTNHHALDEDSAKIECEKIFNELCGEDTFITRWTRVNENKWIQQRWIDPTPSISKRIEKELAENGHN